jgi:hypothetical protein
MKNLVHFPNGPVLSSAVLSNADMGRRSLVVNSLHPQISTCALPHGDNQVHCFVHNTRSAAVDMNCVIKLQLLTIVGSVRSPPGLEINCTEIMKLLINKLNFMKTYTY